MRVEQSSTKGQDVYEIESVPWEDGVELVRAVVIDSKRDKGGGEGGSAQQAKEKPHGSAHDPSVPRATAPEPPSSEHQHKQAGPKQPSVHDHTGSQSSLSLVEESELSNDYSGGGNEEESELQTPTTPTHIWMRLFHKPDYLAILRNKA